jgi:hypothetical protein
MLRSLLLLTAFSLSGTAIAQNFDYSFIQGSYVQLELDEFDGDGFGLDGSLAVTDHFHVFGSYSTADFDFGIDVNQMSAGVGFNTPVSDAVDVIASVAYEWAEVEAPGFGSVDEDGYGLGLGLRAMVNQAIEVDGGISYVDLGDDSDGETSFGAGFLYHFSDAFAVGLSGDWGDDIDTYQLNGRFSFDR